MRFLVLRPGRGRTPQAGEVVGERRHPGALLRRDHERLLALELRELRRHSRIRRLVASVIESWSSTARAFLNRDRSRSLARVFGHPVGHARG